MNKLLDLTKPAKEVLLDKFNASSGMRIPYEFVEIESITALVNPTEKEDTKVTFAPTTIAVFLNKFSLTYKRMDLSDIFTLPNINVPSDGYGSLYELLDNINEVIGVHLQVTDVEPATVDNSNPLYNTILIKAKDSSPLYKGAFNLPLDTTINLPQPAITSNSYILALVKDNNGKDTIKQYGNDGYLSKTFSFLRNISTVDICKINKIFNLDSSPIVLDGEFQLVEPNLPFIDPVTVYKTITIDKVGNLLSARQEQTPLALVDQKDITRDIENKYYYIVDSSKVINVNNKHVYRLFENATIDNSFIHSTLDNNIVNILPNQTGIFTISKQASDFVVKKFTRESVEDTSFSHVVISPAVNSVVTFNGFVQYGLNNAEVIKLFAKQNDYSCASAIDATATTVVREVSQDLTDFFSPVIFIKENGSLVEMNTAATKVNNKGIFTGNNLFFNKLLKDVNNECAIYALNSFSYLKNPTICPLLFDEQKKFKPNFTSIENNFKVIEILNIKQNYSGYETYCLVKTSDHVQSIIIAFDKDHNQLSYTLLSESQDVFIQDFLIMDR